MITKIFSSTNVGIDARKIELEIDINKEKHFNLSIIGIPWHSSSRIKQRISIACKNVRMPLKDDLVNVNIFPANMYINPDIIDMPILVGMFIAFNIIKASEEFIASSAFVGELSFDGTFRKSSEIFPLVCEAKKNGFERIFIPSQNVSECSLVDNIDIIPVRDIIELSNFISGKIDIVSVKFKPPQEYSKISYDIDFNDVRGQENAKRAMQICAAGGHNVLLYGSPGSGKSMLAKRIKTILPLMSHEQAIETCKIYSIHPKTQNYSYTRVKPFRSTHHTITEIGLIGGGRGSISPGEISLSHNGILFVDEITEFKRSVIDLLRQPMEDRYIHISRAHEVIKIPSSFTLVAAMNPCPCGYYGDQKTPCKCSMKKIKDYLSKLSGPFIDRMDLQIFISPVEYIDAEKDSSSVMSSKKMAEGVKKAMDMQYKRYGSGRNNSDMTNKDIELFCQLTQDSRDTIKEAFNRLKLSMRSYNKILKISRTIADIEGSELILNNHVKEAFRFRSFDKFLEKYQ